MLHNATRKHIAGGKTPAFCVVSRQRALTLPQSYIKITLGLLKVAYSISRTDKRNGKVKKGNAERGARPSCFPVLFYVSKEGLRHGATVKI